MSDNSSDSDSESRRAPVMRAETSVTGISLGKTFAVLRIPLVIAILAAIIFELAIYFVVRQLVRAYEACVIWWGGGIGAGRLFRGLRSARSYDEYMEFARAIDRKLGVDTTSGGGGGGGTRYFDGHMVVRITRALRRARVRVEEQMVDEEDSDETDAGNDEVAAVSQSDSNRRRRRRRQAVLRLCEVLRQGAVRGNAGGWENSEVWSRAYAQRNPTVDAYVAEVERSLACVRQTPVLRARERLSVFADLGHQLGRTALCLSGGAAMCWKHLGVARCLLDEARLPRVISGTSAGSLVAAMLATYTDTELRRIVRPELAKYLTACQTPLSVGLRRWLRRGHYFDAVEWAGRVQVFTRGNMTFREAFERTGKVLNISCTPVGQSSRHCSAPRLLNYVTAPDVLVWSAVLASAGLPGVLPPMVLLMKTRGGRVRAYTDLGVLWRDGSFRSDIPYGPDLRHLNVQFTVVSQVNPHIAMFFYDRGGSIGQPPLSVRARRRAPPGMWRGGFVLSALEHVLKLDIRKWLRLLCDLNLVPLLFNQDWSYVWLQKFDGNVTVLPRGSVAEWAGLLRDPSEASLRRSMQAGAEATWPKIQMLAARQRIEDAVASGWAEGYQQMKRKAN
ncbi:hypothetical protein GGF42_008131 [Coemansia sp. RSA 2424]|nr:hypothetical protein GGF42_008131 [Coemansia sp. RSA 2424]